MSGCASGVGANSVEYKRVVRDPLHRLEQEGKKIMGAGA